MSTTAPRCHLCLKPKRLVAGFLVCDHCDHECPATKQKRRCEDCEQGAKSQGRGPSS